MGRRLFAQLCACSDPIDGGGLTRRDTLDQLARGGLAALLAAGGVVPTRARAADDDVVRIGYLPITDAATLLVAHAKNYFEDAGLKVEPPTLIRSWSRTGRGVCRRQIQSRASAQSGSGVDALQQPLPGQDPRLGSHQRFGSGCRSGQRHQNIWRPQGIGALRCRTGIRSTISSSNTRCANRA